MRFSLATPVVAVFGLLTACGGPKPIPQDKAAFIGEWRTVSGFTLLIKADGRAQLFQPRDRIRSDTLAIHVAPPTTEVMAARFEPGELTVGKEFLYGKRYRIDKPPFKDGDSVRMVLNGVTFSKH